jgi:hypothetical protein
VVVVTVVGALAVGMLDVQVVAGMLAVVLVLVVARTAAVMAMHITRQVNLAVVAVVVVVVVGVVMVGVVAVTRRVSETDMRARAFVCAPRSVVTLASCCSFCVRLGASRSRLSVSGHLCFENLVRVPHGSCCLCFVVYLYTVCVCVFMFVVCARAVCSALDLFRSSSSCVCV